MKYLAFFIKFIVITFVIFYILKLIEINFFMGKEGFNKTVGWAFDLTDFIIPFLLFYISSYLALIVLKAKVNLYLSIGSLVLIICTKFFIFQNMLFIILFLSSFLLFLSNVIYSICLKFKSPK
jgi:hypothetical protein